MKDGWLGSFVMTEGKKGREKISEIPIDKIEPNPFQPRRNFSDEKINELAQSIKTHGLLQPIIVRPKGRKYQLVVGERRLMACKSLGWRAISSSIMDLNDAAMATVALIENIQRENLNYIEEARGYARLLKQFNLTQEVLAQRLGKNQSTIANKIRLLKLPMSIQEKISEGKLTERHARALLKLDTEEMQKKLVEEIIKKGLNVSQTEERIKKFMGEKEQGEAKKKKRGLVKDVRIFLNTIREAVSIIKKSGLSPQLEERESEDYIEVFIRLPKQV